MDDQIWRDVILFNKSNLCDLTTIHLRFLDRCVELGILSRHEKDVISKSQLEYDQNSIFYDIILRKSETVFNAMVQLMRESETRQSDDVLRILKNTRASDSNQAMSPSRAMASTMSDLSFSPLTSSIQQLPIWFDVVQPLVEVVGRESELINLHKLVSRNFGKENLVTITSQMTCVSGLGGIGKTTLVRKYAFQYREYFNGNVIWIKADSKQQIQNSFGKLISRLKIEGRNWDNPEETVSEILEYFGDRNSLFIFDNVEEYFGVMDKFLPLNLGPNVKKPYILMTTRKDGFGQKIKNFKLGVLSRDNAARLITSELELECETDKAFVLNLVDQLECLPLAIQQAISYIQKLQKEKQQFDRQWNPIEHYLILLQENEHAVLEFDYCRETNDDYKSTVFRTWKTTMTRISDNTDFGKTANFIMKLLAYFNPDSISLHILILDSETKYIIQKSMSLLAEYSMIEINKGFISIHRLVQQVIRIQNKTIESELLKECLTTLTKNPDALEQFFTVWKSSLNYDDLVHDFPRIGLRLCENIHFGCDSVEIFQDTSDKFIQVFGPDSVFTIELDCIRIISLCHDMRKPDYDLILKLFDNLIIRVQRSSVAHISVLSLILQRLAISLTKVGIGMWPLPPMTSRIELLQKLLGDHERTTKKSEKVKRLATSYSALTVDNQLRLRKNPTVSNAVILWRNELIVLHNALTERPHTDQLVVTNVHGQSGVGKTMFVQTYIEEFASFYEGVIWINFQSKETVIRSLVEASKTFNLKLFPFGEDYSWASIEYQCRFLLLLNSTRKTYLVIFLLSRARSNQCVRLVKIIDNYYVGNNPCVILVSRIELRQMFEFEVNVIHLNGFKSEDAIRSMQEHLNPGNYTALQDILFPKLLCFPLALYYASEYIAKQRSKAITTKTESEAITEYLELIDKYLREVRQNSSTFSIDAPEESVLIVWSIAKSKIEIENYGFLSEAILNVISYCDPEAIPINLVESMFSSAIHSTTTNECLQLLDEYRLITYRKPDVSMHPLLQKVIRERNKINEYNNLSNILRYGNFDSINQDQLIFLWRQFSFDEKGHERCWNKQDIRILREILEKFESVFGATNRYTIKSIRHGILSLNRPDCPDPSYLMSLCQQIIQKLEGFSSNESGSFTSNNIKKIFPTLPFKIESTDFVDAEIQLYNAQFEFDKRINNCRINFSEYLESLIKCLLKCERTNDILAVCQDFETLMLFKDNSMYCGRQMMSLASCLLDIGRNETEIKCDILINEATAISARVTKFYKKIKSNFVLQPI